METTQGRDNRTMPNTLAHDFAVRLAAQGVSFKVRNNRLWVQPEKAYKKLPDEDRAFIRRHRTELKLIAEFGVLDVPKDRAKRKHTPEESEPEVYAYGRRITERDVIDALKVLGDDALAAYKAGHMTKANAYEMARHRLRQTTELEGARRNCG